MPGHSTLCTDMRIHAISSVGHLVIQHLTLMLDITESAIHISQGIFVASDSPQYTVSATCEYMKYSSRKDQNWNGCFSTNFYISCGKVERWVVSQEQQGALNNFPTGLTKTQVGWISIFRRWVIYNLKKVDHARSSECHLSCNCDFVVRYNHIQRANANIAGNADHTNSVVAPTKAYGSLKDYLELTGVNQNQGVTISDVHDLHIKGLEHNKSQNHNSMGYKLLACLRDDPTSLWH